MHMGAERIGPIDILNRLHRFDRCQPIGRRRLNRLSQKDRGGVFRARRTGAFSTSPLLTIDQADGRALPAIALVQRPVSSECTTSQKQHRATTAFGRHFHPKQLCGEIGH